MVKKQFHICLLTLTIVETNSRTRAAMCRMTIPNNRSNMMIFLYKHRKYFTYRVRVYNSTAIEILCMTHSFYLENSCRRMTEDIVTCHM